MKLELQACKTPEDRRAWEARWALHLAGRVVGDGDAPERPSGGDRLAGGGRQPS
jgi:hypothetical protein